MKVTVNVPDHEWWHLSELAEQRGVRVADLIMIGIKRAPEVTQDDLIKAMVNAGLPDADIAAKLNILVYRVAERRRWMGLKPNRRPANWGREKTAA